MSNNNITDGTVSFAIRDKRLNTLLDILYPIGSVKITVTDTAPFSEYGFGTWQEVSKGRVLWGADDSHKAGSTIEAGLPNITGNITMRHIANNDPAIFEDKVFYAETHIWGGTHTAFAETGMTNAGVQDIFIDASRCSSVYGKSTTVTPPHTSCISGNGLHKNLRQYHIGKAE